jgi:O-antigen ligase
VSTPAPASPTPTIGWRSAALVVIATAGGGLAIALALNRLGPAALLLAAGVVVALALVGRPGVVLALLLVPTVLFEASSGALPPGGSRLFAPVSGALSPVEMLFLLLALAVMVGATARREFRLPEPFTVPLLLLVLAIVMGIINGLSNGASAADIRDALRLILYLVLVPFAMVNVLRTRTAVLFVEYAAAALAVVKSALGVGGLALGYGIAITGGVLTYYEPTANWLAMTFLLGVLIALLARVRLPLWAYGGGALALLSLVLSFRRSFWIGTVIAILIVVLVGSGRVGRRYILVGAVTVVLAVWLSLNVATELQGPGAAKRQSANLVVERIQSLDPAKLSQNAEDRYRIDERNNVLDEIGAHPFFGIGLGVPWAAPHPLSVEHDRRYVHFTALWYWLRMGILGVAAYAWIMIAGMLSGLRLWRRAEDDRLRIAGLAMFGGLVGLAVAETTATFTGVDQRFTIVIAAALGWLSAAQRYVKPKPKPG